MGWLSLADLAARGHVVDEWRRWQQGGCGSYAAALLSAFPHLRLGVLLNVDGVADHFVAHDSVYAYDSAGRHLMPYLGVQPDEPFDEMLIDQDPDDWDLDEMPKDFPDALAHAERHNIAPALTCINVRRSA
jgi:hypothetical protein